MAEQAPITCPKCAKKFKTKTDVRGKKIRCPFCTESFVVPVGDRGATAIQDKGGAPPQPGAAEAPTVPPFDEWNQDENPYGVVEADLRPRCPNCANEMESEDAVVCLSCGYNTLTREWGKTEKMIGVSAGRHFVHLLPGFLALFCMLDCILERIFYSVVWPFWVQGTNWMTWSDHESL